jgi:hypothetical protein
MKFDKDRGNMQLCHPERSEGSACARVMTEILRCAQDDMEQESSDILSNLIGVTPHKFFHP